MCLCTCNCIVLYILFVCKFKFSIHTHTGESESESIVETTECDRPFPVTNLQPSNDDSSTSIDFSWYPPLYVNGTYFSYGVSSLTE